MKKAEKTQIDKRGGGRPAGTHSTTRATGTVVRVIRDLGLRDEFPGLAITDDPRNRRLRADYAEDRDGRDDDLDVGNISR